MRAHGARLDEWRGTPRVHWAIIAEDIILNVRSVFQEVSRRLAKILGLAHTPDSLLAV